MTRRSAMRARWRAGALCALLLVLAVYLAGCFTADAKLEADGTGTVDLTYGVAPNAKAEIEKGRWTSSHVKIKSFEMLEGNKAHVVVDFDDATALSTAEGFENVQVSRSHEGDDEVVRIVIKNAHPSPNAKDEGRQGPTITITFPGTVKEANRNAEVSDRKVTWHPPLMDLIRNPSIDLMARYAAAAATTTTTSTSTTTTEPPKAKATKATPTTVPAKGKKKKG